TLLRSFALASSLGILLKVAGAGFPEGRAALLALPAASEARGRRPLRRQAVQSLLRSIDHLDRAIAEALAKHPGADDLWSTPVHRNEPFIEVPSGPRNAQNSLVAVRKMREHEADKRLGEVELYWPDEFAVALGRKAGCVEPRDARAGWGRYVALTTEHV